MILNNQPTEFLLLRAHRRALTVCVALTLLISGCGLVLKPEDSDEPPVEIIERSVGTESPPEPEQPIIEEPQPEPPPPPPPRPAPRYALQGRLDLSGDNSNTPDTASIEQAVVYFEPAGGARREQPGSFQVDTIDKVFVPGVLVIPVGSEVSFHNQDDILHNVFSVSSSAEFDLGFYGNGESRSYVFDRPGRILINCSVHDSMSADILVMATPFYTRPDGNGNFQLDGLPAGGGELKIWHPQANPQTHALTLPVEDGLTFEVVLTKPTIPAGAR